MRPAADIAETGALRDGQPVRAVTIRGGGLRATLLTHGARLHDLRFEDDGVPLLAAPADPRAYDDEPWAYSGAIVGPVANRIAGAAARLDGVLHRFAANAPGPATLHGGPDGTHARNWTLDTAGPARATFTLTLRDGEGGFPANRVIDAHYMLGADAALTLTLTGMADAPTWLNLAAHPYWSLDGGADISGHRLSVAAPRMLPVDDDGLVTGVVAPVEATGFDFRAPRPVGPGTALRLDHNFCLAGRRRAAPEPAARLVGARGTILTVETTEPGLQVFDAAPFGSGGPPGQSGAVLGAHCGLALEPQGWPDAPNRPAFPPVTLTPPDTYRQVTRFRLSRG